MIGALKEKKSTHIAGFEGKPFFNRLADINAPVDTAIDDVNLGDAVNDDIRAIMLQTHGKSPFKIVTYNRELTVF